MMRRLPLATLPTPLHELPRLRDALGGSQRCPKILIKRDDLTGLALGGNKARKLEFLIADAIDQGCDIVLTTGAAQSNHARMTAAAAGAAGLGVHLVLTADEDPPVQGNLLLDYLLGANVQIEAVGRTSELQPVMETLAAQLRAEVRRPYVITVGGSTPLGAAAYAEARLID